MTDIEILDAIVEFIKSNVAEKLKLKKPPKDNVVVNSEYELVKPSVFKGWVPPKNYTDLGYDIPYINVMEDEGYDDNDESQLSIRLKIVTYDPGTVREDKSLAPNVGGYIDLLNVINLIRRELSQNTINKIIVNKPIKWSMDAEQSYPYWSADLSFTVSNAPLEFKYKEYI